MSTTPTRRMVLDTNFNHKLGSDLFVHITVPPREGVSESNLLEPIEIEVRDDPDFTCTVHLYDLYRVPLGQLRDVYTLPSHGLTSDEFKEWWMARFPGTDLDTPMAVYYFKKIAVPATAQTT